MADYPREIYLDEDTEQRLISYIEAELLKHDVERGAWKDDIEKYMAHYWAQPSAEQVTFPFVGASNVVIPLSAITVESVHARMMQTLFALPQFTSVSTEIDELQDSCEPLRKLLDYELLKNIDIYEPIKSSVLEIIKYGSGVMKDGYRKITKTAIRTTTDASGREKDEEFTVVTQQGATVDSVPVTNFIMPFSCNDPQTAPWVGEFHSRTPYDVKTLEQSGYFREGTLDKLRSWLLMSSVAPSVTYREPEQAQQKLENREPHWPERIDYYELWMAFDVDASERDNFLGNTQGISTKGYSKEIVVMFHRESRTFMSIRYNWYEDLRRPYETGVYFEVEHRWPGLGVCQQNEQFQIEVTTQHRQRLDSSTIANTKMYKVKRTSQYGPNEPIFPGKMWFVDDEDDISTLEMGDVNPSATNNENQTVLYSQQRTGVNEVTLGMPQVGTPGTATSDMARIQEGSRKFDHHFHNTKRMLNKIVLNTACNIRQFGPARQSYLVQLDPNGVLQDSFFKKDISDIRAQILYNIALESQSQNKLVDRQTWMQVTQMLQTYYTEQINLAQALQNPQLLASIAQKAISASTEAMRQILQSFDIHNIDRIVFDLQKNGPNQIPVQGTDTGPQNAQPNAGVVSPPNAVQQYRIGGPAGALSVQQ